MTPRIAKMGRSFKGAMLYYLHDKKALTSDRVEYTETVNLPTDDPHRATAHMIDTAAHHNDLKRAAGRKTSTKLRNPVYCYSIAWHPHETPTKEEQLKAAHETIKKLGLEDRQIVIVAHNDKDHPHVHMIVNRVHPETGIAKTMSNDELKLSEWALDYRKARGEEHLYCPNRIKNIEARKQGQYVKHQAMSRTEYYAWKKVENDKIWTEYRNERDGAKTGRKPHYDVLWHRKEARMAATKHDIKKHYKPMWRDLFKRQRQELKAFDHKLTARLNFAFNHYEDGKLLAILRAFTADKGQRLDFIKTQDAERAVLGKQQKEKIFATGREITAAWKRERDELLAEHQQQDKTRLEHYKGLSDTLWKQDQSQSKTGDFDKAAKPEKKPITKAQEQNNDNPVKSKLRSQRKRSRTRKR